MFETAADRAVFLNTDDFGAAATWTHDGTSTSINGIFDAPWSDGSGLAEVDHTQTLPAFICRTDDLPVGAGRNDSLTVGGVAYRVRELRPDSTGMTMTDLERA